MQTQNEVLNFIKLNEVDIVSCYLNDTILHDPIGALTYLGLEDPDTEWERIKALNDPLFKWAEPSQYTFSECIGREFVSLEAIKALQQRFPLRSRNKLIQWNNWCRMFKLPSREFMELYRLVPYNYQRPWEIVMYKTVKGIVNCEKC